MAEKITVAELFAGVGGFRLGLEGHPDSEEDTGFKVVFSNQWEPGKRLNGRRRFIRKDLVLKGILEIVFMNSRIRKRVFLR